jgi:hypothetical protein
MSSRLEDSRQATAETEEHSTDQKENRPEGKKSSKEYIRILLTQLKACKEQIAQLSEKDFLNEQQLDALNAQNLALRAALRQPAGVSFDEEETSRIRHSNSVEIERIRAEHSAKLAEVEAEHAKVIDYYRKKLKELVEMLKTEREKTHKANDAAKKAIESGFRSKQGSLPKTVRQQVFNLRQLLQETKEMQQVIAVKMPIVIAKVRHTQSFAGQINGFISSTTAALETKVLQIASEKRKLQEELMTLKGNIRVVCKVRPPCESRQCIAVKVGTRQHDSVETVNPLQVISRSWKFDAAFDHYEPQQRLTEYITPVTNALLDGFNVGILALGQSGTGKTFTMQGTEREEGIYSAVVRKP